MPLDHVTIDQMADLYRQINTPVIPDPFCATCKGTGKYQEESHHSGTPYQATCNCIYNGHEALRRPEIKLKELFIENAREIITTLQIPQVREVMAKAQTT